MINIRPGDERGHTRIEWLDSRHTFSFDRYHDPEHMNFRQLRVINEDWVAPGEGFPTHSHRDMEIITYVLEGALEHKDSLGTGSTIRPGEVQRMSAGRGISHSEFNHSQKDTVHLLQIWIMPKQRGLEPSYEQRSFNLEEAQDRFHLVATGSGAPESITIHQDVELYVSRISPGKMVEYRLSPGRHAWIQVARGDVSINGKQLKAGDGAAVSGEEMVEIKAADKQAEILLFDLG
jgi:quercetin 2,3-dioxygenase